MEITHFITRPTILTILFLLLSVAASGQVTVDKGTLQPGFDFTQVTVIIKDSTKVTQTYNGGEHNVVAYKAADGDTVKYLMTTTFKRKYTPPPPPVTVQANQPVTQSGVSIQSTYIGSTDTDDYVSYSVNLTGRTKVSLEYSRQWDNPVQGTAEIRAGSITGPLLGTIITPNTGSWTTYSTIETAIVPSTATTVFIVFKSTGVGNIKTFTFK